MRGFDVGTCFSISPQLRCVCTMVGTQWTFPMPISPSRRLPPPISFVERKKKGGGRYLKCPPGPPRPIPIVSIQCSSWTKGRRTRMICTPRTTVIIVLRYMRADVLQRRPYRHVDAGHSATLAPSDDPPTRPPSRGNESSGDRPPAFIIPLAFHISSRHDAAT